MPLVRTLNRELKAAAMVGAPRLSDIQPVILGGFSEVTPPKVKLWEVQPINFDGSAPASKTTVAQNLLFLAHQTKANKEQFEGVQKAFEANGGLSLVTGLPSTGKTFLLILQALTAFSSGHKVLLAAPGEGNLTIRNMFGERLPVMPNGKKPRIYLATSVVEERIGFAIFEFTCARHERDENKPVSIVCNYIYSHQLFLIATSTLWSGEYYRRWRRIESHSNCQHIKHNSKLTANTILPCSP
jgi:hypothetical protein